MPIRIAREPLLHFAVLGLALWAAITCWNSHTHRYTVTVDALQQKRLARIYTEQFGHTPSQQQLQGLIDSYVEQEIALREGLALHLDGDDEIIRRRIIQKYEFLQSDLAVPAEPTPAQLQDWFSQNPERYRDPGHLTLSQLFFSPDRAGEAAARTRAVAVLDRLRSGDEPRGTDVDSFPGPAEIATLTPADAVRIFGQSELAGAVFSAPVPGWQGPYRSGYGWHLVRVSDRVAPYLPSLQDVREQVRADYLDEQRRLLQTRGFSAVRSRYSVRVDPPE